MYLAFPIRQKPFYQLKLNLSILLRRSVSADKPVSILSKYIFLDIQSVYFNVICVQNAMEVFYPSYVNV